MIDYIKNYIPNHVISTDISDFPEKLHQYETQLAYRSMLVKKTKVIPIECIVRGYISGSAWESYKKDNTVCGIKLPGGIKESEQFPEPLFTPSTKAKSGHDINISISEMKKLVIGFLSVLVLVASILGASPSSRASKGRPSGRPGGSGGSGSALWV